MILGQRLKEFRQAQNLSQGDLEARTGLLRCYISRIENGHTTPALETLERWTKALNIPLYQLFYGEPDKRVDGESDFPHDKKEMQLRKFGVAFKKMSSRDRQILFEIARQMAAKKSRTSQRQEG